MFGLGKPKRVTEWEADGEIEQIYHQIKQSLRVSGVNLNFRTWAGYPKYFSDLWAQVRPMVETRAFEEAADDLRAQAVGVAQNLTPLNSATRANPGESQSYQIKAALDLYHYVNPKLLLLTSAVKISLESNPTARTETGPSALIERGVPDRMYPMEMIEEEPDDPRISKIFDSIKETLSLSAINSDYRTLALWPDYLAVGWKELRPQTLEEGYRLSCRELRQTARELASSLPSFPALSVQKIEEFGESAEEILEKTTQFEQLLPSLIVNIALFKLDWCSPSEAAKSPFPTSARNQNEVGAPQ